MSLPQSPSLPNRSQCPVACSLDILGDKWTLLVVRDLFVGKATYGELQAGQEGIPTNILADRLKRLERSGIISKQQYHARPLRYRYALTKKGEELGPVLLALVKWGSKYPPSPGIAD